MSKSMVAGSTGLVGKLVVKELAKKKGKVFALARNNTSSSNDSIQYLKINYDSINLSEELKEIEDVFICLGTTIKKAGSKEAFKKVDVDYCLSAARESLKLGAKNLSIVTSIGADENSSNFYLKMKGLVEKEISKLSFESISIYRPGLLIGSREEMRTGEFFAQKIQPLLIDPFLQGSLKKYRSIRAEDLARYMVKNSGNTEGINIYYYSDFKKFN